jgi:hypothetical protein
MSQASDDLRVTRLLAMVQTSHLSHAGVWILTLVVSFKLLMIFCRSIQTGILVHLTYGVAIFYSKLGLYWRAH